VSTFDAGPFIPNSDRIGVNPFAISWPVVFLRSNFASLYRNR
jgi:hypothetical protein